MRSQPAPYLQGDRLTAQQRTNGRRVRLRAQDGVHGRLIAAVEAVGGPGVAGSTYLVFSSDNGFHRRAPATGGIDRSTPTSGNRW
jgi:hypothetical protein